MEIVYWLVKVPGQATPLIVHAEHMFLDCRVSNVALLCFSDEDPIMVGDFVALKHVFRDWRWARKMSTRVEVSLEAEVDPAQFKQGKGIWL